MRHKGEWKIFYALKYAFFCNIRNNKSASEYYFNGHTQI